MEIRTHTTHNFLVTHFYCKILKKRLFFNILTCIYNPTNKQNKMTSLITDEIKYQIFDALLTKLKEELDTGDEEYNDIMEKMIIDNPSIFISYGLLHHVIHSIEIDIHILREVIDEAWKQILDNKFLTDFKEYFLYTSVPILK